MNLALLQPLDQNFPQEFDGSLGRSMLAVTCSFNRFGTLFGVGCNDGRIVIWDFFTRGIAKVILAHVRPVSSLSWSRNGDKLASASTDCNVSVWDVATGECEQRARLPGPVLRVQLHPRDDSELLALPLRHPAVLLSLGTSPPGHRLVPADDDKDLHVFATYDKLGEHIFAGDSRGKILILDRLTLQVVKQFSVTKAAFNPVRGIEFSRRRGSFLVNTTDRVIRVYDTHAVMDCPAACDPEPVQKLQDVVDTTLWKKCCFSADGEYVCAGSTHEHKLYIWEKSQPVSVKTLEGKTGETLLDLAWHPVRPILASVSSGAISVWAHMQVDNWPATFPGFKAMDESINYEEKEGDFDEEDEDGSVTAEHIDVEGVEDDVDVVTVAPIPAYCSSDEEDVGPAALLYLPMGHRDPAPEEEEHQYSSSSSSTGCSSPVQLETSSLQTTEVKLEISPMYEEGQCGGRMAKKSQGM